MEMTRRQFALSIAAASCLRPLLFGPPSPIGVPRGVIPGRVTWAHDAKAVAWDLRKQSMILIATASAAAALVYMNIGTMGRTRSTRAISEKRTGSNFSRSAEFQATLERALCGGVRQFGDLLTNLPSGRIR